MRSRRDAPAYPRRLKTGAASSTMRWRVRSPLVGPLTAMVETMDGRSCGRVEKNRPVGFILDAEGRSVKSIGPGGPQYAGSVGSVRGVWPGNRTGTVRDMC